MITFYRHTFATLGGAFWRVRFWAHEHPWWTRILAVVFVATLFIPNTPLRESNDDHPVEDAGQQVLDAYASESGEGDHRTPGEGSGSVSGSAASDLTGARRG